MRRDRVETQALRYAIPNNRRKRNKVSPDDLGKGRLFGWRPALVRSAKAIPQNGQHSAKMLVNDSPLPTRKKKKKKNGRSLMRIQPCKNDQFAVDSKGKNRNVPSGAFSSIRSFICPTCPPVVRGSSKEEEEEEERVPIVLYIALLRLSSEVKTNPRFVANASIVSVV